MSYAPSTDNGSQALAFKYSDPLTALKVSQLGRHVRAAGIYEGGLLRYSGASVYMSPCKFEICDNTFPTPADQISGETTAESAAITLSATKYIVLNWARSSVAGSDFVQIAAVNTPSAGDLVVGQATFSGGVVTGISYTTRTQADLPQLDLRVIPSNVSEMAVYVQAGKITVNGVTLFIPMQRVAISSNSSGSTRWDVVYARNDGTVQVIQGVPSASPLLPVANGGFPLARVIVANGLTSVTAALVTDLRSFHGASASAGFGATRLMEYTCGRCNVNPLVSGIAWIDVDGNARVIGTDTSSRFGGTAYAPGQTLGLPSSASVSERAVKVYLTANNVYVLTDSGLAYAAGYNANGELGVGDTSLRSALTPCVFPGTPFITKLAVGYTGTTAHVLALDSAGNLYGTGYNAKGQLGDTTTTSRSSFVLLPSISGVTDMVVAGTGASGVSMALTSGGSVYTTGSNSSYCNGSGAETHAWAIPPSISSVSTFTDLQGSGSGATTVFMALTSTGVLYGWGDNSNRVLNIGTTAHLAAPTPIVGTGASNNSSFNVTRFWLHGSDDTRLFVESSTDVANLYACGGSTIGSVAALGVHLGTSTVVPLTAVSKVASPYTTTSQVLEVVGGGDGAGATGYEVTFFLTTLGLWACGRDDIGQLGVPSVSGGYLTQPQSVVSELGRSGGWRGVPSRTNPVLISFNSNNSSGGNSVAISQSGMIYSTGGPFMNFVVINYPGNSTNNWTRMPHLL